MKDGPPCVVTPQSCSTSSSSEAVGSLVVAPEQLLFDTPAGPPVFVGQSRTDGNLPMRISLPPKMVVAYCDGVARIPPPYVGAGP